MNHSSIDETQEEQQRMCLSRLAIPGSESNGTAFETACAGVWDGFLCWDLASPGSIVYLTCPAAKGMDITKQAFRYCGTSGQWLSKDGLPDERGWTNYTACFTPEILALLKRLYSGSESDAVSKIDIARRTRIMEIFGLSFSLIALLMSLFVFCYFRSLRNPRTRLHRHLFVAMLIQVTVRLTLYIDQFVVRSTLEVTASVQVARGIDNTPILCEAAYIFLEYARTAMFMWMFVEGLYLHNVITATVFQEKLSPMYPLLGWVLPIPLTSCWAIVTARRYGFSMCFWGYNFTWYFWILEGPRLGVLVVNLAFLLNILRVLVTKLRQSSSSETHQVRKAVRAALVLLPLLGLTNFLNMINAPLERSAIEFGIWSYTTHALTSCQGLILAFLYCFRNGEVQLALRKYVRYKLFHGSDIQCFGSTTRGHSQGRGGTIVDEANVIELANSCSRPKIALTTPTRKISAEQDQSISRNETHIQSRSTNCTSPNPNSEVLKVMEDDEIISEVYMKADLSIQQFEEGLEEKNREEKKTSSLSRLRIWVSPSLLANQKGIFIKIPT